MGKVIGIVIPDDCKNIYVFQSKQEFTEQAIKWKDHT